MLSPLALRTLYSDHSSGRWRFGSQRWLRVAEAEDALLGAALLLVAPGAAERRVEAVLVERLLQPLGLPHVGVQRAMIERVDALRLAPRGSCRRCSSIAGSAATLSRSAYMSRNFQVVSTWSSGNGSGAGEERLLRQMQHHRRILADRIEHHRPLRLGDRLAQDVDALGLEPVEMGQLPHCGQALAWGGAKQTWRAPQPAQS